MNELETGVFNSSLIFNYLLQKKSDFTLYLEDGSKLSGALLGWDADFLLIKEGHFLQMVRIGKIIRLQAEFDRIVTVEPAAALKDSAPPSLETDMTDKNDRNDPTAIKIAPIASSVKFKPILTEVKTSINENENSDSHENHEFKNKLDHLVKNW